MVAILFKIFCFVPSDAITKMVYTLEAGDMNLQAAASQSMHLVSPKQIALYSAGMGTSYTGICYVKNIHV